MKQANPQYITDKKGKKLSVVLPLKDYRRMMDDLDELEDIRMYDEVKARKEETTPFDEYLKQRKKTKHG